VPETTRRQRVAISQLVVPVPATRWLGVIVVSTPNLAMSEVFARLADDVARSLQFLDPADEPAGTAPARPEPAIPPRPTAPAGTIGYLPAGNRSVTSPDPLTAPRGSMAPPAPPPGS
jgi:hypothetical protein